MDISELKAQAKCNLRGNWGTVLVITFIHLALTGGITFYFGSDSIKLQVSNALVSACISILIENFYLRLNRTKEANFTDLIRGIDLSLLVKSIGMYIWMGLIVFLYSLLLIIPGIMKGYSYSLIYYIMLDNPNMGIPEVMRTSEELMKGYRMELFKLDLSFLGWFLVAILTCGLGTFYYIPYYCSARVCFYEELKKLKSE